MTSLKELTDVLLRNPSQERFDNWRTAVLRRRDNLALRGNKWAYNYDIPANMPLDSIAEYVSATSISRLFGYEHAVRLEHEEHEEIVKFNEEWLPAFRKNGRIIINNPLIGAQSWYDPRIAETKKHNSSSKNIHASKYSSGTNRKEIEIEVFEKGKGYLAGKNRIFLFYDFDQVIGETKGETTSTVKLQVDRMKKQHGYYCLIHGYPVNENSLG